MLNGVGLLSFQNWLFDHRENMRVWHHQLLGAGSYPLEIRFKGDGVPVPQCLTIYSVGHPPSSDEPLAKSLRIVVEVKNYVRNQHVMRAISPSISELSQSQTWVVSNAPPNSK